MFADIIQDYSPLRFTFDRDTLSALSGLANLTRVFSPGRYLAGLWENDLYYQLGWESEYWIEDGKEEKCHRPCCYLAPLFSWASRLGPVKLPSSIVFTKLCSIVEVQSTPKERDVFGRVKDGHIVLHGKVIYGVAESVHATYRTEAHWRVYSRHLEFDIYEDEEEMKGETLNFFNIFIMKKQDRYFQASRLMTLMSRH